MDVFSEEEVNGAFIPFGLANLLHTTTRERFIRRQLTIAPLDPVDPLLLAESARALRANPAFRKVIVEAEGTKVLVETYDVWTLLPHINLSKKGGQLDYTIGLEEGNLFGMGRRLDFRYENGSERISRSLLYSDPEMIWPHTMLQLRASDLSDGTTLEFGLTRPFYSLKADRAGSVLVRRSEYDAILYERGEESGRYKKREQFLDAEAGFLVHPSLEAPGRVYVGIESSNINLRRETKTLPVAADDRRFLFVWVGYERVGQGWIVRRQVDQIDRDEDFNFGLTARIDGGVSIPVLGADLAAGVRASGSIGTPLNGGFAIFSSTLSTRLENRGVRQTTLNLEARGYDLKPPFTLAFRTAALTGFHLDPENQIELDALSGLRGYRLHAVAGTGRVVGNIEGRLLLASEVLHLVSFAVAAFADAGVAWGDPDGLNRLCDAGIGLRFGLTRASKNTLLRLDIARAFRPDPLGRTGWLVSFSSGAAF